MNANISSNEYLLQKDLEYISNLNFRIHIDMDYDLLIKEVIISLRELVEFDGCNIALIDEEGFIKVNQLPLEIITNKWKRSQESIDLINAIYNEKFEVATHPMWMCKVARENKELYLPEIKDNDFPEANYFIRTFGLSSVYYLPIKLENDVLGTIMFANYGSTMYLSEIQKDIIRRRMIIIARIIENSMLYNQINKQKKELEEQKKIIDEDLKLAQRIQKKFINELPNIENIEIDAKYEPMIEIGGDYYDFCQNDDSSKLGILITDASGHGVQAALITSILKMAFENQKTMVNFEYPDKVLLSLNTELQNKISENYVTALYTLFDFKEKIAKIACAGHNPLILLRDSEIYEFHPRGRVLGIFENSEIKYEIQTVALKENDIFVFYTDGLNEAINENGIEFEKKFHNILKENCKNNLKDLNNIIFKELGTHTNKKHFDDDIALVSIRILSLFN